MYFEVQISYAMIYFELLNGNVKSRSIIYAKAFAIRDAYKKAWG